MPEYSDSVRTTQDKDEIILLQTICMEEKDNTISTREEEIQQLRHQLQQSLRNDKLLDKRDHLGLVNQQLVARYVI